MTRQPVPLGASLLTVSAALVWSLGALTNRWTSGSDAWQYLLWRSIGIMVVLEVVALVKRQRSPFVTAWTRGWLTIGASFGLLGASVGFVYALKNTTAANAAFYSSLSPFVAAILGWVELRERIHVPTLIAMAFAGMGIAVMGFGPAGGNRGNGLSSTLHGNLSGLGCSIGFAVYVTCIRAKPQLDWAPVMPGYCSMLIPISIAMTTYHHRALVPAASDITKAVFHGAVLIVAGTYLFNRSARKVPAVAMTVFSQIETICVPIWILIAFHEVPGISAVIGGALILAAVLIQALGEARGSLAQTAEIGVASTPIPG